MNEKEIEAMLSNLKIQWKSYGNDPDFPFQAGFIAGQIYALEIQLKTIRKDRSIPTVLEYTHST